MMSKKFSSADPGIAMIPLTVSDVNEKVFWNEPGILNWMHSWMFCLFYELLWRWQSRQAFRIEPPDRTDYVERARFEIISIV